MIYEGESSIIVANGKIELNSTLEKIGSVGYFRAVSNSHSHNQLMCVIIKKYNKGFLGFRNQIVGLGREKIHSHAVPRKDKSLGD